MGFRAADNGKLQEAAAAAGLTRRHAKPRSRPPPSPKWKTSTGKERRAVWRPAVPSWEKEFCLTATAGLFRTWQDFVEAKKYVHLNYDVMHWDDKEAQESFDRSKTLFYAKKFNIIKILETSTPPDPDLYIDKIDWDNNDSKTDGDSELTKELGPAIDDEEEEINTTNQSKGSWDNIAIEDIKPSGWDVEAEELFNNPNLTGLIVGGHSRYWC